MANITKEEEKLTDEIKQSLDELVGTNPEAQKTLDQLRDIL